MVLNCCSLYSFVNGAVLLLLLSCTAAATTMTEYEQFRVYPYLEKADRLHKKQNPSGSVAEIDKALALVPQQPELLNLRFRYQIEAEDLAGARQTLVLLTAPQRKGLFPLLLTLQLKLQEQPDFSLVDSHWQEWQLDEQVAVARLVISRMIALKQEPAAQQWLATKGPLRGELVSLHASLADALRQTNQVIADLSSLPKEQLSDTDKNRMMQALLNSGQQDKARQWAQSEPESDAALLFNRQQLQQQIARKDWAGVAKSFQAIEQYHQLTLEELQQKLQWQISQKNWQAAFSTADKLQLDCWSRVDVAMQSGDEREAKRWFDQCDATSNPKSWLVYAEKWLDAEAIAKVELAEPQQAQQRRLVVQKKLAEGDYVQVLQLLLADPKQSQQFDLVLQATRALPQGDSRLKAMHQLHQYKATPQTLDELSFHYINTGQPEKALALIEQALPFSREIEQQKVLPQRLLDLLQSQSPVNMRLLAKTDSWTVLAEQRAELWRIVGRCSRTIELLSEDELSAAGYRSLALCLGNDDTEMALLLWQKAYQKQPQPSDVLHIAYIQQKLNEPEAAFASFTSLDRKLLADTDKQVVAWLGLDIDKAEQAEAYLLESSADHTAWYLAAASLRRNQQRHDEALSYLNKITKTSDPQWVSLYSQKAWIYHQQGQLPQAEQAWLAALEKAPKQAELHAGYGYLLLDMQRSDDALQHLKQAAVADVYQKDAGIAGQVAYLSAQNKEKDQTLYWIEQSIDRQALADKQNPLTATELYRLKRFHQTIAKQWQISGSVTAHHGASQSALETASDQPLLDPVRNDAAIRLEYFIDSLSRDSSVYLQLAANGRSDKPLSSYGQEIGVAHKPVAGVNLWLSAAAQQYPIGSGEWRSMLRLSADFFNQAEWLTEWRPEQQSWLERKLFIDAVFWPEQGQLYFQGKFEQGKVFKLGDTGLSVLRVYGLTQLDYRKQHAAGAIPGQEGWQWTAGLGLQSRFGTGESYYDSYQHQWEINLEWQYQLAGDLSDDPNALSLQLQYRH